MKFLLDQGISPQVALSLAAAGHDAVHVRELGMSRAGDAEILARAHDDGRVIITEDTDFGTLLVLNARSSPSVVLFRDRSGKAAVRTRLLLDAIPLVQGDLIAGAVVVIDDTSVRVRRLEATGESP
ncbi:MAG: DUF5615 family PIN-like protein [Phycisphaerales bacterium]|nr:DUF5615 family PIN-like protein [Phycisphaerales bacterium]